MATSKTRRTHIGALYDCPDDGSGQRKFLFRLNNPRKTINPRETVEFNWDAGQWWFANQAERDFFILLIRTGRNLAIRFCDLDCAYKFWKCLEAAEIKGATEVSAKL